MLGDNFWLIFGLLEKDVCLEYCLNMKFYLDTKKKKSVLDLKFFCHMMHRYAMSKASFISQKEIKKNKQAKKKKKQKQKLWLFHGLMLSYFLITPA